MADPARVASVAPASIHSGALGELDGVDQAVYRAIAVTTSPTLDCGLSRLSSAADHSKLWLAVVTTLALRGGRPRRAATATYHARPEPRPSAFPPPAGPHPRTVPATAASLAARRG